MILDALVGLGAAALVAVTIVLIAGTTPATGRHRAGASR
jgi:hypothetical protein